MKVIRVPESWLYKKCYVKLPIERNHLNENRCTWTTEPEGGFFFWSVHLFWFIFPSQFLFIKGNFTFCFYFIFSGPNWIPSKPFNPGSTSDAFHSNASVYFDETQPGVFQDQSVMRICGLCNPWPFVSIRSCFLHSIKTKLPYAILSWESHNFKKLVSSKCTMRW